MLSSTRHSFIGIAVHCGKEEFGWYVVVSFQCCIVSFTTFRSLVVQDLIWDLQSWNALMSSTTPQCSSLSVLFSRQPKRVDRVVLQHCGPWCGIQDLLLTISSAYLIEIAVHLRKLRWSGDSVHVISYSHCRPAVYFVILGHRPGELLYCGRDESSFFSDFWVTRWYASSWYFSGTSTVPDTAPSVCRWRFSLLFS